MSQSVERRRCPDEFQARITLAGGVNKYDEPNFKIYWGQTETFRAGGEWAGNGQVTYKGYRDLLLGGGDPTWLLVQWQPAHKYGRPESYYLQNCDESTGLQVLGEYPYSGRYEIVMPFIWRGFVNGRFVVEHMPLTSLLVDMVVPIVKMSQELSYARWKAIIEDRRAYENKAQVDQIEARLHDALPRLGEIRSAARLSCNSVLQKKMESIEQHWKHAVKELTVRGKGISIGHYR